MSIRMKEWGMLREPEGPVRVPVEGVIAWDEFARDLGRGVNRLAHSAHQLQSARERVKGEGELAAFSEQLHRIGQETAAEISSRKVEDWEYTWNELCSPRMAEAVSSLSPAARSAGAEMAAAYSMQASLRARRDYELNAIEQARHLWQQRVDDAVNHGDAERAEQWLQSGEGVFVPAAKLEEKKQQVSSRACVARWQRALQQHPLQTLADYAQAQRDSLPQTDEESAALGELMQQQRHAARRALALSLAEGTAAAEEDLRMAVQADVLTEQELQSALAPPAPLGTQSMSAWLRRIDETPANEAHETAILMALGTTPMAPEQRRHLRDRMNMAARVDEADRRTLSRELTHLYADGCLGCPTDAMVQHRLLELQKAALPLLAQQGASAVADWMQSIRRGCDTWVCYNDLA